MRPLRLPWGASGRADAERRSRGRRVACSRAPGSSGTHYGPVIVNIVSGSLTYVPAGTCVEKTYAAGESFVDAGHGHVHSAYNPGSEPTVFVATFFEAPATGALLIPADPGC